MSKKPLLLCALMIFMTLQPVIANTVAPNDSIESNGQTTTLSVDGYVSTKFSSVGDSVEIFALTRGHSMSNSGSTNTIVTADILHYPESDPIGIITQGETPSDPVIIDTVVMQPAGVHDNDSSTLVWEGEYIIPINALGGVYGASITAEEGVLRATDNPTQIPDLLIGEIEKVLTAIDTTWDTANPTMEIKAVFDNLNSSGADAGGWANWVNYASRQPGIGESGQLWSNMINAGYNNYEMESGAKFLESLMQFLESSDLDAGMAFLTGLMTYGNEFPLPQTVNEFQAVADYMGSFDPIENFTRFSGTDNFSAAYDAMLGSNEWASLEVALDNLANNTMVFESFQTVLQNIALLSVSIHPEALIDGVEAWIAPLRDGDFDSMTPFQKLVSSWAEMEVTFQDLDGDDVPDEIIWEYELLLNTTEGLQWQAKMDTTYPYISEGFDDFNSFDVEILDLLIATTEDPAWNIASDAIVEFASWVRNATLDIGADWEYDYESSDEDDDDSGEDESSSSTQWQDVIFENFDPIQNSLYDKHVLDLGFELYFDLEGSYDSTNDYPDSFNITLTNSQGTQTNIELTRDNQWDRQYVGRYTASSLELETLTFSQPMANYNPPCKADDSCYVGRAELDIESIRPTLLETMPVEVLDEIFLVSAIGVLVEQDEVTQVGQSLTVDSTTYDAVTGAISGANVDTAILRISPGLAESAVSTLSPDGELTITNSNPSTLSASYSSSDIDGVFSVEIDTRGDDEQGRDLSEDQYSFQGYISEDSNDGTGWDLSSTINSLPYDQRGVATITSEATTNSGLNLQITEETVLPSSPGCTISKANQESDFEVRAGWKYGYFNSNGMELDRTSLNSIDIDWGDGSSETLGPNPVLYDESWTDSHSYSQTDGIDEYMITMDYNFEHSVVRSYQFVFKEYQGIEKSDEDGNIWYEGYVESNEEWSYCQLNGRQETYTPGPSIINEFITDGPFEVMAQQISTSDSLGKASLTVTPPHTGVYVSIVQSEIIRSSDGETLTGIGLNLGAATQGAISLSGMDVIDHFAGLPVYAANVSASGLQTVNIGATGLLGQTHKVTIALAPLDLSIPFPDVPSEIWSEAETNDLQFTESDQTRSQELRFEAPLSLIAATSFATSDDGEVENQLSPLALHIGLVLTNPEELDITGTLGPGQTTNIALDADLEQATRMLAVASPSQGFDTATVDFSTVSELIWDEAIRPEMGWIEAEEKTQRYCENIHVWNDSHWDENTQQENVRVVIRVIHESEIHPYLPDLTPPPSPDNMQLFDSDGNEIQPLQTSGTSSESTETTLTYDSSNWAEGQSFTFETNTEYASTMEFEMQWDEGELRPEETNRNSGCNDDYDLTDGEIFDIFDQYVGRLSSIAWGQGSSADLSLPYLSSPLSEYTVIGVAQQGSGTSATMVSAVSTTLSETNPEPPELQNLSLVFTPQNPSPGDIVLVTITDEDNNPVEGLSITLVRENQTLSSLLSDENGQGSFAIPIGTIVVRISGGQYYPVEFTIVVTEEGIDDGSLPGDMDGDGVGDLLDAFPNDPTEWTDTDGDNIGNNADTDDDSDGLLDLDEISSDPQTNPLEADTDGDGYCDGLIPVQSSCVAGDLFPADSSEWKDSDGDGIGDNSDDTPFGDIDDQQNQSTNETNNTNQTSGSDSTDQGEDTSDSTSGNMLVIGGSIAIVVIVIIIGLVMFIRGRGESESNKWLESDDSLFDDPGPVGNPPSQPPVTERGEFIDGYEAIEYPPGTGSWFYRDPNSGQWMEWK